MQFTEYCIESKRQNGCKCIGVYPRDGVPDWKLRLTAREKIKMQNLKYSFYWARLAFTPSYSQSNHEVNHHKSGTICILFKIPRRIYTWLSGHANPEMLETSLCSLPAYYLVFQEVPQYLIRTDLPAPSPSAPRLPCLLWYFAKPTACYTAGTQYMFELN